MAAERSIKLRLEAEVSQYKKSLDDAAQATERLAASQDLASKKVEHAAAVQKNAADKVRAAEENLKKVRADSSSSAEQLSAAEKAVTKAKLDDTQASQGLREAERGLAEAKNASTEAALKQESVLGRFEGFIDRNAAGVQAAGTIMVGFGAAVTGVGLAAVKTGIQYNTLQQTTRKALTTLTGSAEAANAQMDKLDAFARTSPFAKGVFIESQQQMIAFGIETSKVIPYLDALNDAVAASGGNSQTIGELSLIMSQISAASKITATDLMQFGKRGIDAAALIGSQMGMTGAQIREEITAGALDATVALDALAAGMSEKFAGAAAGVKETFSGAIDRLKASWREFGALLAEPLVSQEGGGLLVDWANNAATLANNFRNLDPTVRNVTLAFVGLTGVAALGSGTFLLMAPRILATRTALAALSTQIPKITTGVKLLGGAAGVAGLAVTALMIGTAWDGGKATQSIEEIKAGLKDLANGATTTNTIFKDVSAQNKWSEALWGAAGGMKDLTGLLDQLEQSNLLTKTQDGFIGVKNSLGEMFNQDWRADFDKQRADLKSYLSELASGATTDLPAASLAFQQLNKEAGGTADSAQRLLNQSPELRDALIGIASDSGLATDDATLLKIAMGDIVPVAAEAAGAVDGMGQSTKEAADAAEAAAEAMVEAAKGAIEFARDWKKAIIDTASSSTSLLGAFDEVVSSFDGVADQAKVTAKSLLGTLQQNADDYRAWSGNIVDIQRRLTETLPAEMQAAGVAMVQELVDAGPESAAAAAVLVGMTSDELHKTVELSAVSGRDAGAQFADNLDAARVPELQVGTTEATRSVSLLEQFIEASGDSYDDWKIDADGRAARNEANGTVVYIDRQTGMMTIDGNKAAAYRETAAAVARVNESQGWLKIGATVTQQGWNALSNFRNAIRNTAVSVPMVATPRGPVYDFAPKKKAPARAGQRPYASGGRVGLSEFASGGRLPSTGLGTDQILGVNSAGNPTAWVDDLEWIINRRSSDKYNNVLNAMNQDHPSVHGLAGFAGGGVPAGVSVGAGFDYDKLAAAVTRRSERGGVTINQTNVNPQAVPSVVQNQDALMTAAALRLVGNV